MRMLKRIYHFFGLIGRKFDDRATALDRIGPAAAWEVAKTIVEARCVSGTRKR